MSIFDLFKTRWSAGAMTQDDRKRLFWYLKRKTSYTAWKREADAFDCFADIFEKQVKEEPVVRDGPYTTRWDTSYPEILKAQVLYEKGLERLRQGDRTVWLYNDRGVFDDATTISQSWHSKLVNHGFHGDIFLDGQYVDDLTKSIAEFFDISQDAGYLQPMMADTPAPEFWGEWLKEQLDRLPVPTPLRDVPEPTTEIIVRTGEDVPVFGIYEPQIKDGAMNYLLAGIPAPLLWGEDGTGQKLRVVWRLIWEDTRYLDGDIPSEESRYFPPQNEPRQVASIQVDNDLLSMKTGQTCLKSGTWAVMDDLNGRAILKAGDTMPQHHGRDVVWVWAQ